MSRRCFVISPIGQTGSPEREHADDVFDFIIAPAMAEVGFEAYRADHTREIGRISEQMFHSILEDDLCIAVLSFDNPNVYYELAIAQAAARPVIILMDKHRPLPFDLQDLRVVQFDLRPRPLRDGTYCKQIVEIVRNLEAADWKVKVPFGENLSPLGARAQTAFMHELVDNFGPWENWLSLLRSAQSQFWTSGATLRWWTKFQEFPKIILERAKAGCQLRFLMMHQDHPAIPTSVNPRIRVGGLENYMHEMRASSEAYSELAALHENIEVRFVKQGCMNHQIVRSDDRMLVNIPMYSRTTSQYPLFECHSGGTFFDAFEGEFECLWNTNSPAQ